MGESLVYTVEEAGQLLGISRATAFQFANEGRIPAIRIGERRWIVPKKALHELLESAGKQNPASKA